MAPSVETHVQEFLHSDAFLASLPMVPPTSIQNNADRFVDAVKKSGATPDQAFLTIVDAALQTKSDLSLSALASACDAVGRECMFSATTFQRAGEMVESKLMNGKGLSSDREQILIGMQLSFEGAARPSPKNPRDRTGNPGRFCLFLGASVPA